MPLKLAKEFDNIFHLFQENFFNKDSLSDLQQEKTKDKIIQKIINENSSSENRLRIFSEFSGYGPLEGLLKEKDLNEIIVNGKDHIFYEKYGQILQWEDGFLSQITFHNVVEKIGAEAGLTVNWKKPFAEGKWRDFRVHILMPPIVKGDFHICLRRQIQTFWSFKKLEDLNWAPKKALEIIRGFLSEKLNFLIVGATSSGKTSILNACLQEMGQNERVLSVEDTDEIVLPNKVSCKLLSQKDTESPKDLIDQECLIRQSLRLRPDRIVMGEVRGAEAKDLLLALSTGHQGSIGTIHGNDHKQALWKLETLAQLGAPDWQSSTIRNLIFSSLQGLIVLEKREGLRFLKGVYKITALEPSGFLFETLFER